MSDKKAIDPIPEEFGSYEEAAEFWDTHDTTDYLDAFETVEGETEFRRRHYEVEIDQDIFLVLRKQAQKRGVSMSYLVSAMLRQSVKPAA